jgi:hypothetical protein
MARSQYVYLVLDKGLPPAAFTVKHELERYLGSAPDPGGRELWRCRDARPVAYPAVLLDPGTLQPK